MANNGKALEVTESHSSPVSPPPFMVGMAEIEMDQETCDFELVNYVAVVDCGTPINPAIAGYRRREVLDRASAWQCLRM